MDIVPDTGGDVVEKDLGNSEAVQLIQDRPENHRSTSLDRRRGEILVDFRKALDGHV